MVGRPESCRPYIVECSNKRRKLLIQGSSSQGKDNLFHCLQDELVEEILCRLPCSKYVIQCKSVCKHWAALISQPVFVRRFIAFRGPCILKSSDTSGGPLMPLEKGESSFVIAVRQAYKDSWKGLAMHLKDPLFNLHDFSISRLPFLAGENAAQVTLVATYNDLVLYRRAEYRRYDYYMCNFQTKQCILLPSLQLYPGQFDAEGFICDPYYSYDDGSPGANVRLNAAYRYSIVVAQCTGEPASNCMAHLFSSETMQWTKIVLSLPSPCRLYGRAFVFGGMIHFRGCEGMIYFDPYMDIPDTNSVIECHLVTWPPEFFWGTACTGLRRGRLQLSSFHDSHIFSSWVLENCETGKWSLQHKVAQREWVPRFRASARPQDKDWWPGCIIGQHPTNPDIVYVLSPTRVLLVNARDRTVEVASKVYPEALRIPGCFCRFQLMHLLWPTPLPSLGATFFHTVVH